MNDAAKGEVLLYRTPDGGSTFEVKLQDETVWLTQKQMASLFQTERSVVTKHIRNILKTQELQADSVCANFAHTAEDGKVYQTNYYSLDMVLSVGYRVNSRRGTEFRIWASKVLKDHIIEGYSINEKRLREQNQRLLELQRAVDILGRIAEERQLVGPEAEGLLKVVADCSLALRLLDDYDYNRLTVDDTTGQTCFAITYEAARKAVDRLAASSGATGSSLFGREKDESFKSSLGAIYQTFGGRELYPSVEEKAAHLLYLVVKDHSFVDGTCR